MNPRASLKPLQHKITKSILIICTANIFFVIALVIFLRPNLINTMTTGYVTNLSEYIKEDIRYTLFINDAITTNNYLSTVSKFPWVVCIRIYDSEGNIQNSKGESNWNPTPDEVMPTSLTVNKFVHMIVPVQNETVAGGSVIAGYLYIAIDSTSNTNQIDRILYSVLFVLVIGTTLLWAVMRKYAMNSATSISQLNHAITSISIDEPSIDPIDIDADTIEVYNLKTEFNKLLDRVSNNKAVLEGLVLERTRELALEMKYRRHEETLRNSLIMNLSHDLKTPLSALMMYLDHAIEILADSGQKDGMVSHVISRSKESSIVLSSEMSTLLEFSASLDRHNSLDLVQYNVKETVDKVLLGFSGIFDKTGNRIIYHHSGAKTFKSSQRIFISILSNLITNASKACSNGVVTIKTSINTDSELVLIVRDSGIGMTESQQFNFLNEKNEHGNYTHTGPKGIGIGLSMVRFWVSTLGGKIRLQSIENEFTEFTVTLTDDFIRSYN